MPYVVYSMIADNLFAEHLLLIVIVNKTFHFFEDDLSSGVRVRNFAPDTAEKTFDEPLERFKQSSITFAGI